MQRNNTLSTRYFDEWPGGKCCSAWVKLDILNSGLSVDGNLLADRIDGYCKNYRVKRSRKKAGIVDGKLVDTHVGSTFYVPQELILHFDKDVTSVVKVNFKPESPVRMECQTNGEMYVIRDGVYKIACTLVESSSITQGYFEVIGLDRICILGYEGCSGWLHGTQCLFCDSNPRKPSEKSVLPSLNILRREFNGNIDKWLTNSAASYFTPLADSLVKLIQQVRTDHAPHLHLMSGNINDLDLMWKYHIELGKRIHEVISLNKTDSYLNLLPPKNIDLLIQAKDAGFQQVIFNMEVWGETDYTDVCPEKSMLMPMKMFLDRIDEAVSVFGTGNVRCGFVYGAQREELTRDGCEYLAQKGVACSTTIFTPKRGTPWANKPRPLPKDVAAFSLFLSNIHEKQGFTPLYCRNSSRSEVLWEILQDGIL